MDFMFVNRLSGTEENLASKNKIQFSSSIKKSGLVGKFLTLDNDDNSISSVSNFDFHQANQEAIIFQHNCWNISPNWEVITQLVIHLK